MISGSAKAACRTGCARSRSTRVNVPGPRPRSPRSYGNCINVIGCWSRRTRYCATLLQNNVLDRRTWTAREELGIAIVTWIEKTYHRRRRQDGLGRLTPLQFETKKPHQPLRLHNQTCHLTVQHSRQEYMSEAGGSV